jgi:hypothetical protein
MSMAGTASKTTSSCPTAGTAQHAWGGLVADSRITGTSKLSAGHNRPSPPNLNCQQAPAHSTHQRIEEAGSTELCRRPFAGNWSPKTSISAAGRRFSTRLARCQGRRRKRARVACLEGRWRVPAKRAFRLHGVSVCGRFNYCGMLTIAKIVIASDDHGHGDDEQRQ